MTESKDETLDEMLNAARAAPPVLSAGFLAQLETQALAAQPRPFWRRAVACIGGVPGLVGVTASVGLGVLVGVALPEVMTTPLDDWTAQETALPAMMGLGWEMDEG